MWIESVGDFLGAVLTYWWALVPGFFLEGARVVRVWWPSADHWLDRHLSKERQQQLGRPLAVFGLLLAAFMAFHDERLDHDETKAELAQAREAEYAVAANNPTIDTVAENITPNDDGTYRIERTIFINSRFQMPILIIELFADEGDEILGWSVSSHEQHGAVLLPDVDKPSVQSGSISQPYGHYTITVETRNDPDVRFNLRYE